MCPTRGDSPRRDPSGARAPGSRDDPTPGRAGHGHGHGHSHNLADAPVQFGRGAAAVVVGILVAFGIAVLVGLFVLWPSEQVRDIPAPLQAAGGGAVVTEAGTVVDSGDGPCGSPSQGRVFTGTPAPPPNDMYTCTRSVVSIDSGPNAGTRTLFEFADGPGKPDLKAGDSIRITRQADATGTTHYGFYDYARGFPLAAVAIVFAVVVCVVARWRGFRALVGLTFAFGILVVFVLPALLDGKPAIPVALVGGALILYAVLFLAHGVNLRTSSALLGTLASMVLAAVLSVVAIKVTQLTGLSEEQNTDVQAYLGNISISGLLLAGFIIGSLGVLNDVTITQAASAFELAHLDPDAPRREIFASAMRVGRDHIASTVYTLVLAYAGGALPLLLLISVAGRSLRDVFTSDAIAVEIVRSSVGGTALALSVPLTTAIAVLLARPARLRRSAPSPGPRPGGPMPRPPAPRTPGNPGTASRPAETTRVADTRPPDTRTAPPGGRVPPPGTRPPAPPAKHRARHAR